jgi:hypothetical protein
MTPKKPTLTAARKTWLASLKPGDADMLRLDAVKEPRP